MRIYFRIDENPHTNKSETDRDITKSVGKSDWATCLSARTTKMFKINPITPNTAAKLPEKLLGI